MALNCMPFLGRWQKGFNFGAPIVDCLDFSFGPSESNCLTSLKLLDSVENKMISERLKSNVTASDSFCPSVKENGGLGKLGPVAFSEEPSVIYECLSTFMYVQIRGGNIQQMGSWHFRPFAIFGPNFLFPAAKDCTLKTAARSNFEFSFPRYGKWLIPQLSLLHEISQTWARNDFLAYSCWMSESRFPVPKKIESLFSSRLPPFW